MEIIKHGTKCTTLFSFYPSVHGNYERRSLKERLQNILSKCAWVFFSNHRTIEPFYPSVHRNYFSKRQFVVLIYFYPSVHGNYEIWWRATNKMPILSKCAWELY